MKFKIGDRVKATKAKSKEFKDKTGTIVSTDDGWGCADIKFDEIINSSTRNSENIYSLLVERLELIDINDFEILNDNYITIK